MPHARGTPDRIVHSDNGSSGSGQGGGEVTQGTTPWVVDDPDSQIALASILSRLGDILTELQSVLDVNVTGGNVTLDASDIEIGAVEIKNAVNDDRAAVINSTPTTQLGIVVRSPLDGKVPDEEGVWDYVAGTDGTEVIPAGGRVLGIAVSVMASGATVTINGGDAIPIPWLTGTVQGVEIAPRGNLVAPTIILSGTAAYLIEFVT